MQRRLVWTLPGLVALALAGCDDGSHPDADADADADTDADADADTDADADADVDVDAGADADADADGEPEADADDLPDGDVEGDAEGPDAGPEPLIALVQYDADARFGDYDQNLASLTELTLEAIEHGAVIVVHPEMSLYGYATADDAWCAPGETSFYGRACHDVSTIAEPVPGGESTTAWAALALEHGVYVVFSVPEVDGETFFNTLGVVGPSGYVIKYRKRALYYVDQAYATPGDAAVVLETPYGAFGLMICMDGTYDGLYYDGYVELGVTRIILSMDWDQDPLGPGGAARYFVARAENNGTEIFAADVSTWDGTGRYVPGEPTRERNGLPDPAVGLDGISYHLLAD